MSDIEGFGFTYKEANSIFGELCRKCESVTKQIYVKMIRRGVEREQLTVVRFIESSDVLKVCYQKLKTAETNRRINVKQWQKIINKLEGVNNVG